MPRLTAIALLALATLQLILQLHAVLLSKPGQVVDLDTQKPLEESIIITREAGERDVRDAMTGVIQRERPELIGYSLRRMLVLSVHTPDVPSLDLVDLPGVVTVSPEECPTAAQQTRELVDKFISSHKQHAIFLVVSPAAGPPNTPPILGIVQQHQIQSKCIGVFTR